MPPAARESRDRRPRRRVVLLGASNLTRGISTVVATAQAMWREPLEVYAALGHGRSYGLASSIIGRQLPGILSSQLWQALVQAPRMPATALITDVGNDILYGAPVEQIVEWVARCVERLEQAGARAIMTTLPIERIRDLTPRQFHTVKRLFFPACPLTFDETLARAFALDAALEQLAQSRGIPRIAQRKAWFGWDPIHVKLRHWPAAWGEILAAWNQNSAIAAPVKPNATSGSLRRWLYLRTRLPAEVRVLGKLVERPQPSGRLPDGTTISLF